MSQEILKHDTTPFLPALYAIINIDESNDPLLFAQNLFASGVVLVQLRNKKLNDSKCLEICGKILNLRSKFPLARIIINDSVSITKELGADGVHLGQNDDCPIVARQTLGPEAIIGLSTHCLKDLSKAPVDSLDYLALGPIFPSRTKSGHAEIVGLEMLSNAVKVTTLPLVAIGGITLDNAKEVFRTGAKSCAVISDLESIVCRTSETGAGNLNSDSRNSSGDSPGRSVQGYGEYQSQMQAYRNEVQ